MRRGVMWLLVGAAAATGLVVGAGSPALAAGDNVRVHSAGSFTAGGGPGSVVVGVSKRTEGCVVIRTGLVLRLSGLTAQQVRVEVASGGQWYAVPVSGNGTVSTARTSPANPTLCKGMNLAVQYRVSFTADAPLGRLGVGGEVVTMTGHSLGRAADASKVVAGRAGAVVPTPAAKPTPTPTAVPTEPAIEAATEEPSTAAPAVAAASAGSGSGGGGLSFAVMFFGVAMVGIGGALLWFLLRRNREETPLVAEASGSGHSGAAVPTQHTYGGADATTVFGGADATTVFAGGTSYGTTGGIPYGAAGNTSTDGRAAGAHRAPNGPPPAAAGGGDATVMMPRLPG